MASILKRAGGYLVRWYDPDGTQRGRTCPDYDTARKLCRDVERSVALGKAWTPPDSRRVPTLLDWRVDGDDKHLVGGVWHTYLVSGKRGMAPLTRAARAQTLTRFVIWLAAYTGRKKPKASDLSTAVLEAYWASLKVSRRSANKYVQVVERAWAWAWERDEWEDLIPRPRRIELPAVLEQMVVAPTWSQMDGVVNKADERARAASPRSRVWWETMGEIAMVLRCTGLRLSQALRLRWDDVDLELEQETLRVRPELGKTKSERTGRVVPIAPVLAAWLRDRPRKRDGFLLAPTWSDSSQRIKPGGVAGAMSELWRAAEVPQEVWKQRPCHAFRKGFVTGLGAAGASAEAVEQLVGHRIGSSVSAVRGTYLDPATLPLRETVKKVPRVEQSLALPFKKPARRMIRE